MIMIIIQYSGCNLFAALNFHIAAIVACAN
jgi:hypothetical protein